ncbi:MAG: sugar phosphate isomerase/epimerase, partial [bacterium]|nr:sugar phosphate isomerase/epimerase [bacterium]
FVRVVVDTPTYHPTPEELLEDLRPLKPLFLQHGVKLAIENHDRFPVKVLAQLVEQAGADWVGICFDTANSLGTLQGASTSPRLFVVFGRQTRKPTLSSSCGRHRRRACRRRCCWSASGWSGACVTSRRC